MTRPVHGASTRLGYLTADRSFSGLISRSLWRMSDIRATSILGSILRLPLRLIPSGHHVRLLRGPAKGLHWISDSSNATCWMGMYELEKQQAFQKFVRPGHVLFDLGANVGFYTLLGSLLVGTTGRVIAFEPAQRNISYLRRHIDLNHIANCDVFEVAVSSSDGTAFFETSALPVMGHISQPGHGAGYQVQTMMLDHLVDNGTIPVPNVIKCDIEGGEYEALMGARNALRRYRPIILLATHGSDIHKDCCSLLRDLGYELTSLSGDTSVSATDELIARPSCK